VRGVRERGEHFSLVLGEEPYDRLGSFRPGDLEHLTGNLYPEPGIPSAL
jgi:hypothetical protein